MPCVQVGLATVAAGVQRAGASVQHPSAALDEALEQKAAYIEGGASTETSSLGEMQPPALHALVLWAHWTGALRGSDRAFQGRSKSAGAPYSAEWVKMSCNFSLLQHPIVNQAVEHVCVHGCRRLRVPEG